MSTEHAAEPRDVTHQEPIWPRSALRRSLLVWGWGQVSNGDRRGFAMAALEIVWVAGFLVVGLPLVPGVGSEAVFLAGAAFAATWVGVAVHAYRGAVRNRERAGLEGPDGGAIELVWLAIPLIIVSTAFWIGAGRQGSPEATVARYEEAWMAARPADALGLLDAAGTLPPGGGPSAPVTADALDAAWSRQRGRLHDELTRLLAENGPGSGIDPDAPFASLRIRIVDGAASDGATAVAVVSIVRHDIVRESLFGLIPTSARRLVDLEDVGRLQLRLVNVPGGWPGLVASSRWTIVDVDLLGEHLGPA